MNNNYDVINEKLESFIKNKQIPNIIFYGDCNSKKENIVKQFVYKIYNNEDDMRKYLMFVDCAHGKGIKFVRDDIKHFAKTNINTKINFKCIVLYNADKLTIDAQSALRRCIEIFSHSTRFFMIVDNISKLLNPIHSRFCSIFVYEKNIHLYDQINNSHRKNIQTILKNKKNLYDQSDCLYNKGISGLNMLDYIQKSNDITHKQFILFYVNKIKKDIRDEKTLLLIILYFMKDIDNISLESIHYI
jgi:DNA polymerase III delta prime subunit